MSASAPVLVVRFSEPDEFVGELRADRDHVERSIVRVSKLARPSGPDGALTAVHVVAGAIVAGRPVLLERYVGELWGHRAADEEVQREASRQVADLEAALTDAGLTVRGGLIEPRTPTAIPVAKEER